MQIYMVFLSFDLVIYTTVFVPMWISLGSDLGPPHFFLTSLGPDQGPSPYDTCFPYGSHAAP